jgi:2-polyprenyl-3-methyl-5-hydroxy-6-metoxy-1,4-benzoquinol methylase
MKSEVTDLLSCRICSHAECRVFSAREMMFGLRHEFEYLECPHCGCLQLRTIPNNLSDYYPAAYYSFSAIPDDSPIRGYLRRKRAMHVRGQRTLLGRLAANLWSLPPLDPSISRADIGHDDAVLDVGCGSGQLLRHMSSAGFSNLTGVDPYVAKDVHYRDGVTILKRTLDEIEGAYDFIMLVHSLEHVPDPIWALRHVYRLLKPGRLALIRTPVADSYAWREYGRDWYQLDAPRHIVVHTTASMRILAAQAGFELVRVNHDSTATQFWASEQYRRDIPLYDPQSLAVTRRNGEITESDLRAFAAAAEMMNRTGLGDQACFYLWKSSGDSPAKAQPASLTLRGAPATSEQG